VARSLNEHSQLLSGALLIAAGALIADIVMLSLFRAMPPSLSLGDTPIFVAQAHSPWSHGFEPPGYPLFLSLFLPLGATLVVSVQALVSLASAFFTYWRTRMLWLALAIVTCPFLILFTFQLLTETLACQLVWIGLVLLAWPKRKWEPVLAGMFFGAAALTRDTLYLMSVVLVLATVRTPLFKPALVAAAFAFLTVLPWQVGHGTGKISDGRGGFALWIGTWERNGDWQLPGIANAAWPSNAFRSADERQRIEQAIAQRNEAPLTQVALDRIRSEPTAVLKTWALRYPRLWIGTRTDSLQLRFERGSVAWYAIKLAFFVLNLAILALALIGAWRLRREPIARLMAVPVAYLGLVLIPFHNVETRYSLPALIPLLFFAGQTLLALDFKRQGSC
jgi:hypothetical protein